MRNSGRHCVYIIVPMMSMSTTTIMMSRYATQPKNYAPLRSYSMLCVSTPRITLWMLRLMTAGAASCLTAAETADCAMVVSPHGSDDGSLLPCDVASREWWITCSMSSVWLP